MGCCEQNAAILPSPFKKIYFFSVFVEVLGSPDGSVVKKKKKKNLPAKAGDTIDWVWFLFDPWIRKIPWRRKWQPTPVFVPGKSHGQRSLAGYRSQRVRHDLETKQRIVHLQCHVSFWCAAKWLSFIHICMYGTTYMWNLKYGTNELIHKTETSSQIQKTNSRFSSPLTWFSRVVFHFVAQIFLLRICKWAPKLPQSHFCSQIAV